MKKIDVGKELLMLHTKYIINNDKPKQISHYQGYVISIMMR